MNVPYCLPIIETRLSRIEAAIAEHEDRYAHFEVWLDYIEGLRTEDLIGLAGARPDRLLFLFRRRGLEPIASDPEKRREIYRALAGFPVLFDLDMRTQADDLRFVREHAPDLRLVLSHHDYERTPDDGELRSILEEMRSQGAYVRKIATYCNGVGDAARLLRLASELSAAAERHIVIGMGPHGKITRVAGALWGGFLVFAPPRLDASSAPGQLERDDLEGILNLLR